MVKLAVVGGNEFVVGFHLAGIRDSFETDKDIFNQLKELKSKKDFGIIILEEKIMETFEQHQRLEIEDSVDPVFIPISTKVEQDSLRRLIKRSVGVDLWK